MVLLERHMVGAGLTVPARGPTAKWYMKWVTTGVCTLENDWPRQQVLGPRPRLHVNRGIDAWHRPPRPDAAPPTHPPANTIKVYVTVSTHQRTWAAVGVTGGDGLHNARATVAFEAAAPSHTPNQSGEATAILSTLKLLDTPLPVCVMPGHAPYQRGPCRTHSRLLPAPDTFPRNQGRLVLLTWAA